MEPVLQQEEGEQAPVPKTLVFFTTANPPTGPNGQASVVQYFKDKFDKIVVIPLRQHPRNSQKNEVLIDYTHRVNMARLTFECLAPNIVVEKMQEQKQAQEQEQEQGQEQAEQSPGASFFDLLDVSKEIIGEPSVMFGSDQYNDFFMEEMTPLGIEQVETLIASVEVVGRRGHEISQFLLSRAGSPAAEVDDFDPEDIDKLFVPTYLHFPDSLTIPATSTGARNTRQVKIIAPIVSDDVLRYIERNRLYSFGNHRMPLNRPIKEIPRNPSIDFVEQLRKQVSNVMPKDTLASLVPVLQDAFKEMLKREVSDQEIAWFASYLKDHNPRKMQLQ